VIPFFATFSSSGKTAKHKELSLLICLSAILGIFSLVSITFGNRLGYVFGKLIETLYLSNSP